MRLIEGRRCDLHRMIAGAYRKSLALNEVRRGNLLCMGVIIGDQHMNLSDLRGVALLAVIAIGNDQRMNLGQG